MAHQNTMPRMPFRKGKSYTTHFMDYTGFEFYFPGEYSAEDKEILARHQAELDKINNRGPIDVQALIEERLPEGTPGIGVRMEVTEDLMITMSKKYDPDNPLYFDRDYAAKTRFGDIIAFPTYAGHDDSYTYQPPIDLYDARFVTGLNHSITMHKPVYLGDVLYCVCDHVKFDDITLPQGSFYRTFAYENVGNIYNQKGEIVMDVIYRFKWGMRRRIDPAKRVPFKEKYDWHADRPLHYYTDEDWDFIRGIWAKEARRGAEPLYWEDVNIGDEPAWTVDGPVDETVSPTPKIGMGFGGTHTLRKEIMDPEIFKTMVRDERDGVYRMPGGPNHNDKVKFGESRGQLINYLARDYCVRMLTNWMGDEGWIENIKWGIMARVPGYDDKIAQYPDPEQWFLHRVPYMKGRFADTHGLIGDLSINKGYVSDKYIKDGKHYVDVTIWSETITGEVFFEGRAAIVLPSRG